MRAALAQRALVWLAQRAGFKPDTANWWRSTFGGVETKSGPKVSEDSALTLGSVYACVRVLSDSIAQLPFVLYERTGERSKRKATSHPLFTLLHDGPNPEITSFELREFMMANLLLRGNALAQVERDRSGRVVSLWPLRWDQVEVRRVEGELVFIWTAPGLAPVLIRRQDAWHVRGLSLDGITGMSPIAFHREVIGMGLAMQEFGARLFSNGATVRGVLEHPKSLTQEAASRLRTQWDEMHGGLSAAHKTAVLEEGMKYQKISIDPNDAQYLESRKFNRAEIASIFRVPPHKIADLDRATFSNIEHQGIEFVTDTVLPWARRFEQSAWRDLLLERERGSLYTKLVVDAFLRGDTQARYAAYQSGIAAGWLVRNEAREKEDLDPIDGLDEPLTPLNMAAGTQPIDPKSAPADAPARALAREWLRDAAERVLAAEDRHVTEKPDAVDALYASGGRLRLLIERALAAPLRAMGRDTAGFVNAYAESSLALLKARGREAWAASRQERFDEITRLAA